MPATKEKKPKDTNLEERVKNLENVSHEPQDFKEKCKELEKKIDALYQGVKELEIDMIKVKGRMGL